MIAEQYGVAGYLLGIGGLFGTGSLLGVVGLLGTAGLRSARFKLLHQ